LPRSFALSGWLQLSEITFHGGADDVHQVRLLFEIASSSLAHTRLALAGKPMDSLAKLPVASDRRVQAALHILHFICPAAHCGLPNYAPLFIMKAV
jgi:hypothetical protein